MMWRTLLMWEVVAVSAHGHDPCRLLHDLVSDFRLDDYTGVWYPLMGWSNSPEGNVRDRCSKETISHQKGNITIVEESYSDKVGYQTAAHHAWQDIPNVGKITMWMFHVIKVPFWVVDTDYKHWAVVYSCTGDEHEHLKTLLVMGRGRDLEKLWRDPEAKKSIRKSLRRSSLLRLRDLTSIQQSDCNN